MILDEDSPIGMVFVAELTVAMYLVWEAHYSGPLWCFPHLVLDVLKTVLLQRVLGASGFQCLQLYLGRFECTDQLQVLQRQLYRSLKICVSTNLSPGREGETDDFFLAGPPDCPGCR